MTSSDAMIARGWAKKVSVREKITASVDDETLAVARYVLAMTTPSRPPSTAPTPESRRTPSDQ